jgi:4-methylaminobutanoate oxidase (formaldehyde-forming)
MSGNYEIEVAGVKVPATASLVPFYDPSSARIKGAADPAPASGH